MIEFANHRPSFLPVDVVTSFENHTKGKRIFHKVK